jgi:2-deoxystreptamine N-acetyl-D-glucosaminyltransferase/2-deoxystreptamine glucosyltransferase
VVTLHCSLQHSVPTLSRRLTALRLLGGTVERRMLRSANAVIALTRTTAARLAGGHRTVVIPSGVEPGLFETALKSPELAGIPRPIVMYVGRLATQKDVPTLVRAFGRMRLPASLVIVGDGPERQAVDAAIAALPAHVRDRVHRFGFRPHAEVPGLLAAADVLGLPSVYEEMGTVLVEALRAGVPIVASRVGGIPDVVRDGETGVLVPPGQPQRWAEALDSLLGSPDMHARMRAAASFEADRYSWLHLADQVLAVYRDVLAGAHSSAVGLPPTRA